MPAYGASLTAEGIKPLKSSDGPDRMIETKAEGKDWYVVRKISLLQNPSTVKTKALQIILQHTS